jgi:diphosphomevalonate decarboxylase
MKATAIAHPNIALTKYWGKADSKLNIPNNNSISINLDGCLTKTTVEFLAEYAADIVYVDGKLIAPNESESKNVYAFLNKVRELAGFDMKAKVVSKNNFPQGSGIASSASGAAALAIAATKAAGLNLSERELSTYARLFSGSGCRSIPAGFVEWQAGTCHEDSYASSIASPEHWEVLDIIAIASGEHKKYGSTVGHALAETSFLYKARLEQVREYNKHIRKAILDRDFKTLGKLAERDAMSLHAVMLTSDLSEKLNTTDISIRYWNGKSLQIMDLVEKLRSDGAEAYFTIDAGPNIHILTLPQYKDCVTNALEDAKALNIIENYIINKPGGAARQVEDHLF